MNAPSPDSALREQLHDLADDIEVGPGILLTGALHRAGRRRRRQVVGTGVVTVAVVAAGVGLAQLPAPGIGPTLGDAASARPDTEVVDRNQLPLPSVSHVPAVPKLPAVVGTVPRAWTLTFSGRDVFALDATTGTSRRILSLSEGAAGVLGSPNSGSLSPNGKRLAVPSVALGDGASGVSGIWVLDLPTGRSHLYGTANETIGSVVWAPDGTRLLAQRWGGGGAWTLDVPAGTFTAIPGITESPLFWDGASRLVTSQGGWRVVDLRGRTVRALPQLEPYRAGRTWTPAEFAGWSPDGRWLAVQRRDERGSTFAAVDVATGRVARTWGPDPDELNTQNVLGWSVPNNMIVMLRQVGSRTGLRLLELDVVTGRSRVWQTFTQADSAYHPAG